MTSIQILKSRAFQALAQADEHDRRAAALRLKALKLRKEALELEEALKIPVVVS